MLESLALMLVGGALVPFLVAVVMFVGFLLVLYLRLLRA